MTKRVYFQIIASVLAYSSLARSGGLSNQCLSYQVQYLNRYTEGQRCTPEAWRNEFYLIDQEMRDCESQKKSKTCQKMFEKFPELTMGQRDCSAQGVCKEQDAAVWDDCLNGYLVGTGEMFVDLKNLAVRATQDVKNKFLNSFQAKVDHPKTFKSPLFADIKFSKGIETFEKTLKRRQSVKDNEIRNQQIHEFQLQQMKFLKAADFFKSIEDMLIEKGMKLTCVDRSMKNFLMCWGAAYIIDPSFATGIFAKSIRSFTVSNGSAKTLRYSTFEERIGFKGPQVVDLKHYLGEKTSTVSLPGIPPSLGLARYKTLNGEEVLVYEKAVSTPQGTKILAREMPIDPLTGLFDANFSGGRDFLEMLVKDSAGQKTYLAIDVNSLGFINNNFSRGTRAGDDYLKVVAHLIREKSLNQGIAFRLGGDELGVVLNTTDPEKVKQFANELMSSVKEQTKHLVTQEKKTRAKEFRSTVEAEGVRAEDIKVAKEDFLQNKSKTYYPNGAMGLSLGASYVENGEDLTRVIARADEQVRQSKIKTCVQLGKDCTKYGGPPANPKVKPNYDFIPELVAVAGALEKNKTIETLRLSTAQSKYLEVKKMEEIFDHIGPYKISKYQDELGHESYRAEAYVGGPGRRDFYSKEIFINRNTGLLDGRSESAQKVLEEFVRPSSRSGFDRGLIYIDARNLGKINYFEGGTQNGDILLKVTGEVLQKTLNGRGLPFKIQGSEFIVALDKTNPEEIIKIEKEIAAALNSNQEIQNIYQTQAAHYQALKTKAQKTSSVSSKEDFHEIAKKQKELEELQKERYRIHSAQVQQKKSLDLVLKDFKAAGDEVKFSKK